MFPSRLGTLEPAITVGADEDQNLFKRRKVDNKQQNEHDLSSDKWRIGCCKIIKSTSVQDLDEILHLNDFDIVCIHTDTVHSLSESDHYNWYSSNSVPSVSESNHYNWYSSDSISFLIHKKAELIIHQHQKLTEYISYISFSYNNYDHITVVGVNVPSHVNKNMREVFQSLQRFIVQNVKTVPLIIMGIFNAEIGWSEKRNYKSELIGPYLTNKLSNLNGTILLNMIQLFKLKLVSTFLNETPPDLNIEGHILTNCHHLTTINYTTVIHEFITSADVVCHMKRKLREVELETISDDETDILGDQLHDGTDIVDDQLYDAISDEEEKFEKLEDKKINDYVEKKLQFEKSENKMDNIETISDEQKLKLEKSEGKEVDELEALSDEKKSKFKMLKDKQMEDLEAISDEEKSNFEMLEDKKINTLETISPGEKLKLVDKKQMDDLEAISDEEKSNFEMLEDKKISHFEVLSDEEKSKLKILEDKQMDDLEAISDEEKSNFEMLEDNQMDDLETISDDEKFMEENDELEPISDDEELIPDSTSYVESTDTTEKDSLHLKVHCWNIVDTKHVNNFKLVEHSLNKKQIDLAFVVDFKNIINYSETVIYNVHKCGKLLLFFKKDLSIDKKQEDDICKLEYQFQSHKIRIYSAANLSCKLNLISDEMDIKVPHVIFGQFDIDRNTALNFILKFCRDSHLNYVIGESSFSLFKNINSDLSIKVEEMDDIFSLICKQSLVIKQS